MSQWNEAEIIAVSDALSRDWKEGAAQMILGLAREGEEARAEVARLKGERDRQYDENIRQIAKYAELETQLASTHREYKLCRSLLMERTGELALREAEVTRLKGELTDAMAALLHCQASRRAMAEHEEAREKETTRLKEELAEATRSLPCGHPKSLEIVIVESDYRACELCESRHMQHDAETMENVYRLERDKARAAALKEAEAICRNGPLLPEGSNTIDERRRIAGAIAALAKEPPK